MNLSDKELNDFAEGRDQEGIPSGEAKAYRLIIRALEKEPSYALPDDFADKTVSLIAMKGKTSGSRDALWFILSIAGLAIGLALTLFLTKFKFDFNFLNVFSGYWGILFFGAALAVVIQVLDRFLIRPRLM